MAGGGASYFPSNPRQLQRLMREAQEGTGQQRLDSDVNAYLQTFLIGLNDRNPEKAQAYLDEIASALKQEHEIEKFLFGGSVAKHTYVDGLSDVDALVILSPKDFLDEAPKEVLATFLQTLRAELPQDEVVSMDKGNLAVTVAHKDGTEIQLLPALRHEKDISISNADGTDWRPINPKAFYRELTKANGKLNQLLVPTIKLMKSILSGLPDDIRPINYHIESLAVDGTKRYRGPMTIKALLPFAFKAASARVLRPIADITNQSRNVDDNLGKANSEQRVKLSHTLAGIARRMNAAPSLDRWKEIIEG